MPDLKIYNQQVLVSSADLRERLNLARLYLALTHVFLARLFKGKRNRIRGTDLESLLVVVCVFIGDAEGRPTTATKIASHSGIPRPSVYRHLNRLIRLKKVVRIGHSYRLTGTAIFPDEERRIARILEEFWQN
jgi:hypothetical protein